ncbi:MAG TPA: nucleotide sugar dehydrogenase [Cyclobacteriaceae bacterium]|jgi:UDP-N-acetyl-D-mannosaminuronic acid dehydrogenase|nr:nucleotide sugar dehydrogenase [Cyclobacteriaceae bacterium]
MKNIDKIIARKDVALKDLLRQLDDAPRHDVPGGIILIVDGEGRIIGTVTDGDVRRAILRKDSLDIRAEEIMTKDPIVFPDDYSIGQILDAIVPELEKRKRKSTRFLSKIILVDDERRPTRVLDYHQLWEQRVAMHRHLCVVGMGYVGLTLALVLADQGYLVTGVDHDEARIASLRAGESYIHEIGLPELLREHINRNLRVDVTIPDSADVFIIAVGTPVENNGEKPVPSMRYLIEATEAISKRLRRGNLVILRSTIPVGTCRNVVKEILEGESGLKCGLDFHLSFAPERTAEGKALKELRSLPQIIGGYNRDSVEATAAVFREITPTIIKVDSLEAAEMAKLINNSFRDYVFAFSNQLAQLATRYNINIFDVIKAANEGYPRDPVPLPSPGVGGPCLTKDPHIFAHVAESVKEDGDIFRRSRAINVAMHDHVASRVLDVLDQLGKRRESCNILVCGLAFKGNPETGDLRDSSSVAIARLLQSHVGKVYGFDAVALDEDIRSMGFAPALLPKDFHDKDAVLFLNNHKYFEKLDVFAMVRAMRDKPVILDAWNMFKKEDILHARPSVYMGLSFTESSIEGV